jgi:hypothetical protein
MKKQANHNRRLIAVVATSIAALILYGVTSVEFPAGEDKIFLPAVWGPLNQRK